MIGLLLLGGQVVTGSTPAPLGPPTNVHGSVYGGSLIALSWSAGDPDAATGIGVVEDPLLSGDPPTENFAVVGPGVTYFETGRTRPGRTFWVRHIRGSSSTDWVQGL